jgi:hypothetical protein
MSRRWPRSRVAVQGVLALLLLGALVAVVSGALQASAHGAGPPTPSSSASESPSCPSTRESVGNLTWTVSPCVAYGFPSPCVKNATLDSRQVLPFIKGAYEYHLVYFARSQTDHDVTYAVLNITGKQVVTGDWSSGYRVSYAGNLVLNVTVLHVASSTFWVVHVSAYALPERATSLTYAPRQVSAIEVALSDAKVRSLLSNSSYYVEFVGTPSGSTGAGNYVVQLYQVNGTRVVGAVVDPTLSFVSNSYTNERITAECQANGLVITDPWNAADFKGCPTPPSA